MVPISLSPTDITSIANEMMVEESDVMPLFAERVQKWLTEIVSDLIGTMLLGPAFVFTLLNLLSRIQDPDACTTDYPSTRMRARICIEELERREYPEMFATLASQTDLKGLGDEFSKSYMSLKQFASSHPQLSPAIASHLDNIVFDLLQRHLPTIKDEVGLILGEIGFRSSTFKEEVPQLVAKLTALVPPCEIRIGEAANVASITNSGLLFMETSAIERIRNLLKDDVIDARQNVNALTFKAIELSNIERLMKKSD
jgi:hypothetical protein